MRPFPPFTPYTINGIQVLEMLRNPKIDGYVVRAICFCGREFNANSSRLKRGLCRSCGCINLAKATKRLTTHGKSYSATYKRWYSMKQRCLNPKSSAFRDYGGRGIKIDDPRWLKFENYYADMGEPPFKDAKIDRVDNDKGYSKENCRWVTVKDNTRNRRVTVFISGIRVCDIIDIGREFGIHAGTLRVRFQNGWDLERCLNTTVKGKEEVWNRFVEKVNNLIKEN